MVLERAGSCKTRAGVLGDGDSRAGNCRSNAIFQLGGKTARLSLDDLSGGEMIESAGLGNHELCETKCSHQPKLKTGQS